jgi:hypothetical protein
LIKPSAEPYHPTQALLDLVIGALPDNFDERPNIPANIEQRPKIKLCLFGPDTRMSGCLGRFVERRSGAGRR